ncbi:hypothetical protein KEM54_006675 [Ascosphaera aggregata]|nr:hypothetical protein KEM54_006675 [Ascosphaera aggregata]
MDTKKRKKKKDEKKEKRHHKDRHDLDRTSPSSSSKKRRLESRAAGDAERKKKKNRMNAHSDRKPHESFLESKAASFSPGSKNVKSFIGTSASAAAAATGSAAQNPTGPYPKATTTGSSSPYHLITSTLYLPLSPISISPSHALSSLLSEHLSPLLLTYYPPFRGLVLAYSNPSMSSTPPTTTSPDNGTTFKPLTLAKTAGEYGVMFVYVTATFLVFRPESGQILQGWVNVQSEGFLGAIVNNLFSVGIDRRRLPKDWKWVAPGEGTVSSASSVAGTEIESEYERDAEDVAEYDKDVSTGPDSVGLLIGNNDNSVASLENAGDDSTGYFVTPSGKRVRGTIRFRVRDVDVIPGAEKDKGFITIEGSMLSAEEEEKLTGEEKRKVGGGKAKAAAPAPAPANTSRIGQGRQDSGSTLTNTAINEESAGAIPEDDAMDIDEPLHDEVSEVKAKKEKENKKEKKDKKRNKKSKKSS